jgi:hypothetical protein
MMDISLMAEECERIGHAGTDFSLLLSRCVRSRRTNGAALR